MTPAEAQSRLAGIADLRRRLMEAGTVQGTMQTPYSVYYELTELWNNQSDALFAIAKALSAEVSRLEALEPRKHAKQTTKHNGGM